MAIGWHIISYLILVSLAVGLAAAISGFGPLIDESNTPSIARNVRASARYHYMKANQAQNNMYKAENDDDVDEYEKWLQIMREEDQKLGIDAAKYEELRDYLEAKIWTGELVIKNFQMLHEKGDMASILDHLTFRSKQ